jgi:hypothetical protein
MDQIKEAFSKVKQDMDFLLKEINDLKKEFSVLSRSVSQINNQLKSKIFLSNPSNFHTDEAESQPNTQQFTQTNPLFKPLKHQILGISIGNRGVPTDKQTNPQTDQQTHFPVEKGFTQDPITNAVEILNSLDNLKKEIRLKFKRLTEKELLVFSTLYQLDLERGNADYKVIANKLALTESSIRDYIGRLISKGIPVEKKKINNKTILLNVSENLKKIATLETILQLREL